MELDKYVESMHDKSKNTVKTYISNYRRLHNHFKLDIVDIPIPELLAYIAEQESGNTKNGFITVAIQLRRLANMDVSALIDYRESVKSVLDHTNKKKNEELQETLPSYGDLIVYTEKLFETGEYESFIINYLLINYNTRNLDLDMEIVTQLDDALDENTNYLVILPGSILYIRNRYKTVSSYGPKSHKISDDRFIFAVKKVYQGIKRRGAEDYINPFVPNKSSIGYRIQSLTYKKIGEGKYVKICLRHYRDDLDELKRISENRGTSLMGLTNDYDIQLIDSD